MSNGDMTRGQAWNYDLSTTPVDILVHSHLCGGHMGDACYAELVRRTTPAVAEQIVWSEKGARAREEMAEKMGLPEDAPEVFEALLADHWNPWHIAIAA